MVLSKVVRQFVFGGKGVTVPVFIAEAAWERLTINRLASKVALVRFDTITAGATVFAFEVRVFGYADVMVEVFCGLRIPCCIPGS